MSQLEGVGFTTDFYLALSIYTGATQILTCNARLWFWSWKITLSCGLGESLGARLNDTHSGCLLTQSSTSRHGALSAESTQCITCKFNKLDINYSPDNHAPFLLLKGGLLRVFSVCFHVDHKAVWFKNPGIKRKEKRCWNVIEVKKKPEQTNKNKLNWMIQTASVLKQRENKICCIQGCMFVFVLKNEQGSFNLNGIKVIIAALSETEERPSWASLVMRFAGWKNNQLLVPFDVRTLII